MSWRAPFLRPAVDPGVCRCRETQKSTGRSVAVLVHVGSAWPKAVDGDHNGSSQLRM
jgi:hypothetical protein